MIEFISRNAFLMIEISLDQVITSNDRSLGKMLRNSACFLEFRGNVSSKYYAMTFMLNLAHIAVKSSTPGPGTYDD